MALWRKIGLNHYCSRCPLTSLVERCHALTWLADCCVSQVAKFMKKQAKKAAASEEEEESPKKTKRAAEDEGEADVPAKKAKNTVV